MLSRSRARCALAVLVFATLLAVAGGAHSQVGPDLGRADALIRAGKAEQAWQLLAPHESQRAGDTEYDYLLAVAALESGRENLATFILERIIAVNADHTAARLVMGRAYFALRDFERAQRQFDAVLKTNPPAHIRSLIRSHQDRMGPAATARTLSRWGGYLEFTLGHDTNVNAATSQGSVFVPVLGSDFVPGPLFVRRGDDFALFGGGLEYTRPLAGGDEFFAGVDVKHRVHAEVHAFDAQALDVHLGLQRRLTQGDTLRLAVGHNEFRLDEAGYRRMQYAAAEWNRVYQQRARVALFAQGNRIRYLQEAFEASSSDLLALGVGGAYLFHAASRSIVSGRVYAGSDTATRDRADGDRRLRGLAMALQRNLLVGVEGYLSFGVVTSEFRRQNPAFGVTREDRQLDGGLGVSFKLAEGWFMNSQVSRTHVRSNIPLNEYRRTEVTLGLRRVWQ